MNFRILLTCCDKNTEFCSETDPKACEANDGINKVCDMTWGKCVPLGQYVKEDAQQSISPDSEHPI